MTTRRDDDWGREPHPLLPLERAWQVIAAEVQPFSPENVPLGKAAGRVLASPVLASDDYPAFDKAMMDGFAVRSIDCDQPEKQLEVLGLVPAGDAAGQVVGAGQAIRINTGAPVPQGADAVVRVEDTTVSDDGSHVTIHVTALIGKHIAKQGCDRKRHDMILAPPLLLESAQMAASATAGAHTVDVYPRVAVAIAVTGNELVPVGRPLKPGQIHDSNGPMLAALMRQFGASPHETGVIADEPAELKTKLGEAMRHPVVMAVGGMSMGTLDLVPQAFADLGVTWRFHGVRVRPGKPVAYGRGPDGQHVFGLPGNPGSAFVCAWLFVRMVVRGCQGHPTLPPCRWRATLTKEIDAARDSRPAFVPARVWNTQAQGLVAEPCTWGGSGDPFGLALANALLVRPQPTAVAPVGSTADVILISTDI